MDFADWVSAAREELRKISPGLEYRAGEDTNLRGYYDDGLSPTAAMQELLDYAANCA